MILQALKYLKNNFSFCVELCVIVGLISVVYAMYIDPIVRPPLRIIYQSEVPVKLPPKHLINERGMIKSLAHLEKVGVVEKDKPAYFYQEWCLDRSISGTYHVRFWDHEIIVMAPVDNIGSKGCWGRFFKINLPERVEPGVVQLKHHMKYHINFLNTNYIKNMPSVTFWYRG
jgi:hypothetical protein